MQYKASAPGSLMLLGEYAVLNGKQSVVCAIDKRITVTLTPRTDSIISIQSSLHGSFTTDLFNIKIEKPFEYVLGVINHFRAKLRNGCCLNIESEFSDKMGLGSSAAVTVATLASIITWLNIKISPLEFVRQGKNIIRLIQGVGSGADIAASVYGGMVQFQSQPLWAEKLSVTHPITVLYSGSKTPTVDAIKQVRDYFSAYPSLFTTLTQSIGQCALEGAQMMRKGAWEKVGEIMNIQQGMMEALGVSTLLLRNMVTDLRRQPSILGAKISGSGLGDCVIGLGLVNDDYLFLHKQNEKDGVSRVPVAITHKGVNCEKI